MKQVVPGSEGKIFGLPKTHDPVTAKHTLPSIPPNKAIRCGVVAPHAVVDEFKSHTAVQPLLRFVSD